MQSCIKNVTFLKYVRLTNKITQMYKVKISTKLTESAYKLSCIIGQNKSHSWNEAPIEFDSEIKQHNSETAYLEITKRFPLRNYKFNFIKKENDVFYYEIDVNKKS